VTRPGNELEDLLKQAIGLDPASIGSSAIERAVRERSSACNLHDPRAYWEHVRRSSAELQELIEEVIVPETWFFRDREAFAALARMAHGEWLPKRPTGVLRVLSLPCSTGEEPYSIAMALLDSGFPAGRFQIDGVDVSRRAIEDAERGAYGRNSFRAGDLDFRHRHFTPCERKFRIGEHVRRHVHFRRGNLLESGWLPVVRSYHAVFCRNLLIYFDHATQGHAIHILERLLAPAGMLIVGASESSSLLGRGFVPDELVPNAFAFRKRGPASHQAAARRAHRPRRHPIVYQSAVRATPSPSPPPVSASQPMPALELPIEAAGRLANQGRMADAERCCEQQLREYGPSAEAYHLMGLIRDAAGASTDAGLYYRRALYLDPNHRDALIHFALLLDRQGHAERGRLLRERARRLAGEVG
jgi:chemotaxis protein methyltransferase WspC